MEKFAKLEQYCADNRIVCKREEPLSDHCTFGIGGKAGLFLQPGREEDIGAILATAEEERIPLMVLGNGSNVLFSDDGYAGVVLHIGPVFGGIRLLDDVTVDCDSGASLKELCLFAAAHSLGGLEFAYGIPGSVGGAIYMNAGAYGGEIRDVLVSSRHVSWEGSGVLTGAEMELSYRHSAYDRGDRVITGGVFCLKKDNQADIQARMDDYMNRRVTKQPLDYPSAGSTFKRPEGAYASALIDQCGLRGKRIGGAMVSEKHAGFIVNAGGATCADVLAVVDFVKKDVFEKTGFRLSCEVKIID